ncbi:MAG: transglycosylase domain-containing protein, partial [Chloroflexi bacterium]|nr:transglycosylase domain-containing protein [Chloroflexota bacterium]
MPDRSSDGWGSVPVPQNPPRPAPSPRVMPRPQGPAPAVGPAQRPPAPALRPVSDRAPSAPPQPPADEGRSGCASTLLVALFVVAFALLIAGGALVAYASIARDLPPPEELQQRASHFASTIIYDRQGSVINEMADPNFGRRTVVPLDRISPNLVSATIATEDPNFYQHAGVDPVGIARAIYHAVREQDLSGPGGSTITQQLVKLTFLSAEKSISRKVKEAILAAEITRRYSKETILQIYLNEINYGNLAYGIEAAAETYFGKSAADLTLAEASLLAGLPQAPSYYDPYTRLWKADGTPGPVKERQGIVLSLMVRHGAITPAQADAAWVEPLQLKPLQQTVQSKYPHFIQFARSQVEKTLGPELLAKGGLRIYTTLDARLQDVAQEEVAKQVKALAGQNASNAALVAIQPKTGEVLAMVGSADFFNEQISGQINMAVSPRQPGSAIKPFTYLAAFEMPASVDVNAAAKSGSQISAIEPPGYWTASTALMDVRTEFPDGANPPYVPTNYDEKEHGLVTVRSALANSYNIPAVKTLEHVGLDRLKQMAASVGITTLTRPDYGLALTLGGGEVTLLELTGAYAVLANGGTRAAVSPIACVLDADGKLIWRGNGADAVASCTAAATKGAAPAVTPAPAQPVLNPQHVFVMTSILGDQEARRPMFGANAALLSLPDRPSAAKTGTSNDYRDAWTLGYTPDLAVGVWVGNADNKAMQKVAGSLGAAPIWQNTMKRALQGKPVQPFAEPPGIQRIRVCADTGTLPSEACQNTREELFATNQGPLPAQFDLHQRVRVDKVTGRLATDFTPADRIETRDVLIFPAKYRAWAEAHGIPQTAIEQQAFAFPPELALNSPANGDKATGIVQIAGRVHLPPPLVWRVEYGVGPDPIGWGVVAGPAQGDLDGIITGWDTAKPVAQHNVHDFSLRLAAYDPANLDYPAATSNVAYIQVIAATPTPSPT